MAGDFFDGKQAARRELERRRRSLSPQEVRSKGEEASRRLLALPFFKGVIASYAPQAFELPPPPGVLPRIASGRRVLSFHVVQGALIAGPLGIESPRPEWPTAEHIDVFIVPAVGLTPDGCRLGRGGGYYDATLAAHPHAVRVGYALDCCVVEHLPTDPWDARMDWIVTESRALATGQPARSPKIHE